VWVFETRFLPINNPEYRERFIIYANYTMVSEMNTRKDKLHN